uniref:Nucleotide-diphospho-sugar transferase domain-containing protein n=1 Tax=Chlamydomonas euryale TaxID=1486919 RepID=A0A7R9VAW7_9CHLO|mmetsp:Transcript_28988/g.85802  ORF Transcript_28988/g.85802 Transcript_28988/m.85802 type:complete len:260 (+) Transcript_28988:252-1031(+)
MCMRLQRRALTRARFVANHKSSPRPTSTKREARVGGAALGRQSLQLWLMRRTGAGPPAGKRACAAVLCVTLLAVAATSAYLLASSKQRGAGGQPPASSAQDSLWSRVLEPKQVAALAHSLPHLCGDSACLDALIPYHEDDRVGLLEHGGLESALKHLKGIRRFFVLSAGNESFRHLLGSRIGWIDEARAPFTRRNFTGSSRPAGWLFQQALKFWAVKSVPELCHDVMVLDADIVWLRDFDPRVGTSQVSALVPEKRNWS